MVEKSPPQIKHIYIYIYQHHHSSFLLSSQPSFIIGLYHLDHQQFIQFLRSWPGWPELPTPPPPIAPIPGPCRDCASKPEFFGCFPWGKTKQNGGNLPLKTSTMIIYMIMYDRIIYDDVEILYIYKYIFKSYLSISKVRDK